jgi:hypothetical protein
MTGSTMPAGQMLPNPLAMPVNDGEFFWNQLVDTVDDYFSIRSEQRVQQIGGVLTEGMIETRPLAGATILEPWHWDSSPGFERIHSTLQSPRRRANIRVIPHAGTYNVEVVVEKVLEDVDRPSQGTPGSSVPRHDSSLLRLQTTSDRSPETLGWIPLGRDVALEQEILRELSARMFNAPGALLQ